ncbi:MAG: uroporphyrinogen-III C-methyltransferase [Deltaproteobacteria bacterium]|nr:uroporphyrinogen-III C-methyltransferase [Deltaproteobacteria bacterium]
MTARLGSVSLVGAGPGDPELLTVRAVRRLEEAEVVLHDALVPNAVVEVATTAKRLCVGKRAGQPSCAQEEIVRLMIRLARQGRQVVRLKCGDPFVLGRGGEEAVALARAGIPCEVVPGVSAALAAPAAAGIPVTHRGLASAFVVVSGHAPEACGPVLASIEPATATLVVLMGLRSAGRIAALLMARGWQPDTPAAVVAAAWTAEQEVWAGTLEALGRSALPLGLPGTIIIGATAGFAQRRGSVAAQGQGGMTW